MRIVESTSGTHIVSGEVAHESVSISPHTHPVLVGTEATIFGTRDVVLVNTEPVASDRTRIPGATVTISFCTGKLVPVFEVTPDIIILQESVIDPVSDCGCTATRGSVGSRVPDAVSDRTNETGDASDDHTSSSKGKSSGRVSVIISSVTITWQFGDHIGHSIGLFFIEVV